MKSYLNDSASYARDLTEAAEAGDWDRYRNINATLAAETTAGILNAAAEAERAKRAALESVGEDFKKFYGSPDYQKILTERPTLAEAIGIAESNGQFQDSLGELYSIAFDAYRAEQARESQQQQPPVAAKQLRTETSRAMATEETLFRAVEASKRVDLSRDNRKKIIAELEQRGIADVEL